MIRRNFAQMFDADKTGMIRLPCGEETMISLFHKIPERNGQKDTQTDIQTELLYQYRASVC